MIKPVTATRMLKLSSLKLRTTMPIERLYIYANGFPHGGSFAPAVAWCRDAQCFVSTLVGTAAGGRTLDSYSRTTAHSKVTAKRSKSHGSRATTWRRPICSISARQPHPHQRNKDQQREAIATRAAKFVPAGAWRLPPLCRA